ncbi:MAG: class I SAM-dependent methyltransferase [Burkholderiales bacterium]
MSDFIHDFWQSQAVKHGASHEASWGDHHMVELEIETIGRHLADGAEVLDVGCANGYATFEQLARRRPKHVTGVDFAAQMIEVAQTERLRRKLEARCTFATGDVRKLDFPDARFDLVYTTRVLINLPNWAEQQQGIDECLRVTRPGGKVVLSEAFWEPLQLLNALRALKQLPPLVEHDFNRYLKQPRLEALLAERGLKFTVEDFSSVYYLGSRFVRELVTDPAAYPGYSNPVNTAFFELERQYSGGGFGIQQAYVIEKS